MEIVLVRHAEPQWYVDDRHQGQDPPLTDLGHAQAEMVAEALQDEVFDEVFVSPMVRARQTAAPILRRLGRDEVIEEWLREIQNPPWENWPREAVEKEFAGEDALPLAERWRGLANGEPIDQFQARIHSGLHEFLERYGIIEHDHPIPTWSPAQGSAIERTNGPRILLVAHGGTNSVVTARLLLANSVPFEWTRFWFWHTSVARISAQAASDKVFFALQELSVNHLPAAMRTR